MFKYFLCLLCLSTIFTGCSQDNLSNQIEKPQNIVDETDSNTQFPQVNPQPEENSDKNEVVNISSLTQNDIYLIQQKLSTLGYNVPLTGVFDDTTKSTVATFNQSSTLDELDTNTLSKLDQQSSDKFANTSLSYMMLVNKELSLKYDFEPENLKTCNVLSTKEIKLEGTVAQKTEEMFKKAKEDGISLILASGYRDFFYQQGLFERKVSQIGFSDANSLVAIAGQSEHQTGLAIDITAKSVNNRLSESFENTAEFKWLMENCADFGFILRYPKTKKHITGYSYEPWHYRYIGDPEIAKSIMQSDITLEEYYNK